MKVQLPSRVGTQSASRFVSFDPGKKALGWAIYDDYLKRTGILRPPKDFFGSAATLGLLYGRALRAEVDSMGPVFASSFTVIHENMQIYRQQNQKGDPNDLIFLSVLSGAVIGRLGPNENIVEASVPREWKGNLTKEQVIERVLGSDVFEPLLDEGELAAVERDLANVPEGLKHNALEAVALGLRKLGRFHLAKGRRDIVGAGLGRPK